MENTEPVPSSSPLPPDGDVVEIHSENEVENEDANAENVEQGNEIEDGKPLEKSKFWEHFTRKKDNFNICTCNHCGKLLKCNTRQNGTSSIKSHYWVCKKRKLVKNDPGQKKLKLEKSEGDEKGTLKATLFDAEYLRKELAKMVITDEMPFRMVEGEGFRSFCYAMQPRFIVPSRVTVHRGVMKIYWEERAKLKKVLKGQRVCLTTDTWSSDSNFCFMVLTGHWIGDDWKLRKKILNFVTVPNHKGVTIGKTVEACLLDWGIDHIFTLTVDNASSNDLAISYLKKKTKDWKATILGNEFIHMRCCAHILNLVVKEGLDEEHQSIEKIRNTVRFVRSSPARNLSFKKCVDKEKIEHKSLVCLDVQTRWNSTYLMLESAQNFDKAFSRLEDDDMRFVNYFNATCIGPPCEVDWVNARAFVRFLKVFYNATLKFSGSLFVTSNNFISELVEIYESLKRFETSLDASTSRIGRRMRIKFEKYWENHDNLNLLLFIGAILDPRYKFKYVKFCVAKMYGIGSPKTKNLVEKIKATLKRLYDHYEVKGTPSHFGGSCSTSTPFDGDDEDVAKSLASEFEMHLEEEDSVETKSELARYLVEGCEPRSDKFDVLSWWKRNESKYPIIAKMARHILAIPVSTVSSESAFSTSGRILDPFRSSLSPTTLEALICAQNWLKTTSHEINLREAVEELEKFEEVEKEFGKLCIVVEEPNVLQND